MARWRSILHKSATLLRLGPRRQLLIAEAAASMLAARLAILIRPFPAISRGFGAFVPPDDPRIAAQGMRMTRARARTVRRIGWAIRATAPFMPFRSVCLQQAMAGHAMLRRRGYATVMHFGAGKGVARPIDTHAWLDAEGIKVTGYPIAAGLAEIACFVRPGRRPAA